MAMISVDPLFAQKYTALAVTHGFHGSPHIDKQNVGPFYGLALGDFEEGTGGILVECSARVLGKDQSFLRKGVAGSTVTSPIASPHLSLI